VTSEWREMGQAASTASLISIAVKKNANVLHQKSNMIEHKTSIPFCENFLCHFVVISDLSLHSLRVYRWCASCGLALTLTAILEVLLAFRPLSTLLAVNAN